MEDPQAELPTVALRPEAADEAATPTSPPAQPPLIVVQYRRNWSAGLLPPILIILIAVLILQARPSRTPTPSEPVAQAPMATVPSAEAHPRGPSVLAAPAPVVAQAPAPAIEEIDEQAVSHAASEAPVVEKPTPRPRPAIGFVRPNPEPGPSPFDLTSNEADPDAAGDRREGLDVIPPNPPAEPEVIAEANDAGPTEAEEARAIREHREALAGLKDRLLEEDRRNAEVRKAEEAKQLKVTIEEKRTDFLRELGRTLNERGQAAGPEIVALCARYGRSIPKESEIQAHKILKTANGYRLEPKARVELLRNLGWPEAMILDELAHAQARNIGRRNGPKNRGEALTAAAKILLSVPLQRPTASLGPEAQPRRPIR